MSGELTKAMRKKARGFSFQKLLQASILLLLVALCAFASFKIPTFLTWTNLVDNLLHDLRLHSENDDVRLLDHLDIMGGPFHSVSLLDPLQPFGPNIRA